MKRLFLASLVLMACDDYGPKMPPHGQTSEPPTVATTPTTDTPDTSGPDPVIPIDVGLGPEHPVIITPPPVVPQGPTRPRRRMDIDQLDRAIQQATGRAWTMTVSGREVNQFEALAATLGKPNYTELTTEDLTPSTLFQKFLDEAARTVCDRLVTAETSLADDDTSERILFRHASPSDTWESAPAAIEKNLSYLLLRFHGAHIAPGDPGMDAWRWLFQSALHVSSDPVRAWRTVCVGLIVHPAFYTY